ncbi:hypothetical protein ABFX02_04G155100 [Erythranthe guttata]
MDEHITLPPGFRFHPTDEELITHYLLKKALDCSFSSVPIGDVDMNKVEPWELPWKAKQGEKEWYFFCVRDKKYPNGLRTNRATAAGYWKATGKDRTIFRGKNIVGMKKTLVFYKGRAPKGEKSNWVNHEYRLEGKFSLQKVTNSSKNDWVISRVFHKTCGGKKVHISGLTRMDSSGNEMVTSTTPRLTDLFPGNVPCFSSSIVDPVKFQGSLTSNPVFPFASNPVDYFPGDAFARGQFPGMDFRFQDPSIFRALMTSYGEKMNQEREMVSVCSHQSESSSALSNLEMEKKPFQEYYYTWS